MEGLSVSEQTIINIIVGVLVGGISFILKSIWKSIGKLNDELKTLSIKVPEHYINKNDMRAVIEEMKDTINNRFNSIDQKFAAVFRKLDGG